MERSYRERLGRFPAAENLMELKGALAHHWARGPADSRFTVGTVSAKITAHTPRDE